MVDEDATIWHGWYQRHNGSVDFLGDHLANSTFGGLDVQSVVLLFLFAAVVWRLWKEVSRPVRHGSGLNGRAGFAANRTT